MCGLTHELKHGVEPLLGDYVKSKFSFSDRILYSREGLCFRVVTNHSAVLCSGSRRRISDR
jgi:hypothetical protein